MKVRFKKLRHNAKSPVRAHETDAGFDLSVADSSVNYTQKQTTYYTGIAVEIPKGYVGLLFPRSSIHKTTLRLSNSVGVIDSGYTGEIKAVMDIRYLQPSGMPYLHGDRFIQLVIVKLPEIEFEEVEELGQTERGEGGFGSSGK